MLGVVIAIVQLWGRAVGPVDLGLLVVMYSLTVLGIDVGLHRLVGTIRYPGSAHAA